MLLGIGFYKNYALYLEESIKEVDKMYGMIQDIINSQNSFSEKKYQKTEKLLMDEVIMESISEQEVFAEKKNLQLQIELEHTEWEGNLSMLQKVLSNLISNAFHYTEAGKKVGIQLRDGTFTIQNQCKPLTDEKYSSLYIVLKKVEIQNWAEAEWGFIL